MARRPRTDYKPVPLPLHLQICQGFGAPEDPEAEWPSNVLSRKLVIDASGRIRRRGDPVRSHVDPDELAMCQRLGKEAARVAAGIHHGLISDTPDVYFHPFFLAAAVDEPSPRPIDEALIRSMFGGTIFPPAVVAIEPMDEQADWFLQVQGVLAETRAAEEADGRVFDDVGERSRWRSLIRWFREREEFLDTAFVSIGTGEEVWRSDKANLPRGTERDGAVFPRLVLGLTRNGSLVGAIAPVTLS